MSLDITYRPYDAADFISLAFLSTDDWNDTHNKITYSLGRKNPIERCVVAVAEGKIVGYAYGFALPNGTFIIEFVYVREECRGKGIAKGLILEIERESNCDTSMVFYNKQIESLYRGLGYEKGGNLEAAIKHLSR